MNPILVSYGWIITLVLLCAVFVPYIRRRGDLITGWNIFLLGSINFVGITAIQSGSITGRVFGYGYFTDEDCIRLALGGLVFYGVGILTYKFFKFPRKFA